LLTCAYKGFAASISESACVCSSSCVAISLLC
jgi:hypothetical protein